MATPTLGIDGTSLTIIVCRDCGVGRLDPLPTDAELAGFYPSTYYGEQGNKFNPAIERLVRFFASKQARRLSRALPPDARILDVGCGRGVLLERLADLGFEVHGTELTEEAAFGADRRAEIRVVKRLEAAAYPAGHFDQIILWHVLEHLPDPVGTLREVHRLLRPAGRLSVAVPNYSSAQARWAGGAWFHLDPPRHVFHFPLPALQRMLSDGGFETMSVGHFSLVQNPFGWVQSLLNKTSTMQRDALYALLRKDRSHPLSNRERAVCLSVFALGMPVGLACSVVAATAHAGATVEVEARRVP